MPEEFDPTEDLPEVPYLRTTCPRCGTPSIVTNTCKTTGPIVVRYHKCKNERCRLRFRSREA